MEGLGSTLGFGTVKPFEKREPRNRPTGQHSVADLGGLPSVCANRAPQRENGPNQHIRSVRPASGSRSRVCAAHGRERLVHEDHFQQAA
jgi:hypothetical protein